MLILPHLMPMPHIHLRESRRMGGDELLSWQKITNSKVEFESERDFSRVILYLPENGANLGANKQHILHIM